MTLLAGWVETTIIGKDAEQLLQAHIAQSPIYTTKETTINGSKFYALAANKKKIPPIFF